MNDFIIYLIGVLFVFIISLCLEIGRDITLGKATRIIIVSICSWAIILVFLIFFIFDRIEEMLDSDKVIFRRKKKEECTFIQLSSDTELVSKQIDWLMNHKLSKDSTIEEAVRVGYQQAIKDMLVIIKVSITYEEYNDPLVRNIHYLINYYGNGNSMVGLCIRLNLLLCGFCGAYSVEKNIDEIKRLLHDNIENHPYNKLYWSDEIKDEERILSALTCKKIIFVPYADQDHFWGITIKYRRKQ